MKEIKYQESYSEGQKEIKTENLFYLGLILIATFIIIFILRFFIPSIKILNLKIFTIGLLISFVLGIPYIWDEIKYSLREIKKSEYGISGEEKVAEILKENLDDNYIYIRNYEIPNTRIGDIDGLLIGPKGVIILEIKNLRGEFKITGRSLYRILKRGLYKLYERNPIKQTLQQKEFLKKFLKEKGVNINIIPMVVFIGKKEKIIEGHPGVWITNEYDLVNDIFKLENVYEYNSEVQEKILQALNIDYFKI